MLHAVLFSWVFYSCEFSRVEVNIWCWCPAVASCSLVLRNGSAVTYSQVARPRRGQLIQLADAGVHRAKRQHCCWRLFFLRVCISFSVALSLSLCLSLFLSLYLSLSRVVSFAFVSLCPRAFLVVVVFRSLSRRRNPAVRCCSCKTWLADAAVDYLSTLSALSSVPSGTRVASVSLFAIVCENHYICFS